VQPGCIGIVARSHSAETGKTECAAQRSVNPVEAKKRAG